MILEGGGLRHGVINALLVAPYVTGGLKFAVLPKKDQRLHKFLGRDFGMYEVLRSKRNMAVTDDMVQADIGDQPFADGPADMRPFKRKRDYDVTPFVTVQVKLADGTEHDVRMLSELNNQSPIAIELTAANFDILCSKAHADTMVESTPDIKEPHVAWHVSTQTLYVSYFSPTDMKWRRKHSTKLDQRDDDFDESVDAQARKLEQFYIETHFEPPRNDIG